MRFSNGTGCGIKSIYGISLGLGYGYGKGDLYKYGNIRGNGYGNGVGNSFAYGQVNLYGNNYGNGYGNGNSYENDWYPYWLILITSLKFIPNVSELICPAQIILI